MNIDPGKCGAITQGYIDRCIRMERYTTDIVNRVYVNKGINNGYIF